jgi:hypothetical protein
VQSGIEIHRGRSRYQGSQKRVVAVELQDPTGKPLKQNGGWSSGEMRQIDLDAPAPADAQLMIHLATPQSVQTFPFKVEIFRCLELS